MVYVPHFVVVSVALVAVVAKAAADVAAAAAGRTLAPGC